VTPDEQIVLAHGGGGALTDALVREHFLNALGNETLDALTDGAVLAPCDDELVLTTDSFVVHPLEFPGGDIGRLAVCGTVNDVAMMGADPIALTLGVILEEGLAIAVLDRIVASIADSAREAGVPVVTGDTKVVERRSAAPGLLVNTTGLGRRRRGVRLKTARIEPGDAILINGSIAEHGLAVMSKREGLEFASGVRSDVAPLAGLVRTLLDSGADVKFLRDPTRGGMAGVLADISRDTGHSIEIDERAVPITAPTRHAAELLGLDPITVANEGKVLAVVAGPDADAALGAWRSHPLGTAAAVIGRITEARPALVELLTDAGGRRVIQKPYGEDLPRIC
jgi:hydrogenase expression/formation protein HypE